MKEGLYACIHAHTRTHTHAYTHTSVNKPSKGVGGSYSGSSSNTVYGWSFTGGRVGTKDNGGRGREGEGGRGEGMKRGGNREKGEA